MDIACQTRPKTSARACTRTRGQGRIRDEESSAQSHDPEAASRDDVLTWRRPSDAAPVE